MAQRIHVKGIVQGVGFRPFVYRLAQLLSLDGWVLNATDGVHILVEGKATLIDEFCQDLEERKPDAAYISSITREFTTEKVEPGFVILTSDRVKGERTLVSPDLATCPDCLRELFDPYDRRYRYPFINCTNCGPRFTIINQLPYDRIATSMAPFIMCASCSREYHDPLDRRFHAQPDACFGCGPHLELLVPLKGERLYGESRDQSDAVIASSVELFLSGAILAVKGLGGYHLACDATNEKTVAKLRERKQRPRKPLAVMYPDLESVRQSFVVSDAEADLLTSPATPIVLLRIERSEELEAGAEGRGSVSQLRQNLNWDSKPRPSAPAPSVAGELTEIGVMLPATPLQHLLLRAVGRPLVMTSGNLSEEPIIGDDQLAKTLLSPVADAFLVNNREIVSRYDDSVLRVLEKNNRGDETVQYVRRARGYAPAPIDLPLLAGEHTVLAVGPEQKGTFCLVSGAKAFISQHLGDINTANAFNNYLRTAQLYQELFNLEPTVLACDMHPDYLSAQWAKEQAKEQSVPLIEVQHHHAHIAAVLAENCASVSEEVIGIALDGTGYGIDGTIWGGEVLIASLSGFTRFAHLEQFRLPGGAQAIKHPLRASYALLLQLELAEHPAALEVIERLGEDNAQLIRRMVEKELNAPLTSSAGRYFDAVSALLGLCTEATYEGEPAILLEAAMGSKEQEGRPPLCSAPRSEVIQTSEIILDLLEGMQSGKKTAELALYYHEALLNKIVDTALLACEHTSLDTVALSGGVFNNRFIATNMPLMLQNEGLTVLTHQNLPPNDGCISYGQAAVACAQLNNKSEAAKL